MKLMVVKLLIPTEESSLLAANPTPDPDGRITQASQARAELIIQDREEAAILINVSTLAPQTQYSTPRLVWRPDGSGVYVSSDDGIVRGIEATTGKIVSTLEAHDHGSKLRCLWVGHLRTHPSNESNSEILISGGFDQKLIAWTPWLSPLIEIMDWTIKAYLGFAVHVASRHLHNFQGERAFPIGKHISHVQILAGDDKVWTDIEPMRHR
jgi:hypothetical protein